MALPTGGGTWPPQHHQPIYQQYAVWNAWYTGDPDQLANVYGDPTARPANRTSQYRGGIVGTVARWFWGAPVPQGERRTKLHVPVAADLAVASADWLYSEPPAITVENVQAQDRINTLIENGLHAALLESAELGSALSGSFLRIVWDKTIAERPWISAVPADAGFPEWRHGRLRAVTLWRNVQDQDGTVYRHLERHEPGWILNGLYKGTGTDLGNLVALNTLEETADLPDALETKIELLTAVYVPNVKPNRAWRQVPAGANLGRSDLAGCEQWFDALDEVMTSWQRDIRLGKARLIVPKDYLRSLGPGQGAAFEHDRELYEPVDGLFNGERLEISAHQFSIRVEEHRATAREYLELILRSAGHSPSSFGLDTEGQAVTATEIAAKNRRSLTTRGKKIVYQTPPIADIVEAFLAIEQALFSSGTDAERPTIQFSDGVSEDAQYLATTAKLLRDADAASDETLVRLVHPDWDDDQILAEVKEIGDARPDPVADPLALPMTGAEPAEGDEGQEPVEE